MQSYNASLAAIGRIGAGVKARIPGSTIAEVRRARPHLLVRAEGVTNEIEVTWVMRKDMTVEFNRGFDGMTEAPVTLDEPRRCP